MENEAHESSSSILHRNEFVKPQEFGRRKFLNTAKNAVIGTALISTSSKSVASQSSSSEIWPQHHFNQTNNGYAPQNSAPKTGSDTEIDYLWQVELERTFGTQPIIIDNKIMIPSGTSTAENGETGDGIIALDVGSGSEQWFFDEIGNGFGCVANRDETVYVLDGSKTYALNVRDGSVIWETEGEKSTQSAAIGDDTIYIGIRGTRDFETGTYNNAAIQALRIDDGGERWSYEFPIYGYEEEINVNTADGIPSDENEVSTPAVSGDTVYVGVGSLDTESGEVYALNTSNGEVEWSFEVNSKVYDPTVVGDSVYFGTGGGEDGRTLYSLNVETGAEQWRYETGAAWSPTIVDETVYLGYYGGFAALDSASGEVLWEKESDSGRTSSPVVIDDLMYVTDGNQLKALDRENGESVWSFNLNSEASSDPIVANQSVFVFDVDGTLYSIGNDATSTQTSTAESAGGSDGSGESQNVPINQQQGTTNRSRNDSGEGGVSFWRNIGSSGPAMEVGVLGASLGLTGIYAVYRKLSDNE
ncbi:outer membrane protein assembly factor BamB family protein [Halorubrum ezzemoulense]|uniref:outer membrane protein assembly factor BamB family protein n=1 Tax=Halorubrum ezzemoulense TaxID=337243 RepID=UPI0023305A3C|nr:PQQ-binding-like beta-propeller repeat protein [Halorubrum ezzemoulense]MDB2242710.1 PQQ-binding-like beta-propeller repeat protein [Halorubrum ezzemoulense]